MMQQLTPFGDQAVSDLSRRFNVSTDAVRTLLSAVAAGGGTMAQFYHPELGGGGQWMQGGMTMVGDMFNSYLQGTVSGLCSELSSLLSQQQMFASAPAGNHGGFAPGNNWWPSELGSPSSSGGQNDLRYAYFPQACRLAVEHGGGVEIYNTLDHQIGGVQQQQGVGSGSLSFSSQYGTFTVASLPRVDASGAAPLQQAQPFTPEPQYNSAAQYNPEPPPTSQTPQMVRDLAGSGVQANPNDVIAAIERLGQLHQQGILSNDEFQTKKSELLSRL